MSFNLTQDDLKKSATTYKKQLLITPIISCEETLIHFTPRPGVAGREVITALSGNIELGPYVPNRVDNDGVNANARTLETFLGSVVKRFDINTAGTTVWGENVAQGKQLTTADLALQVLTFLSGLLGQKLNKAIWAAKRNDSCSMVLTPSPNKKLTRAQFPHLTEIFTSSRSLLRQPTL